MTRLLFQEDSYLKEADAEVLEMVDGSLVLDRTIFYPQGGGQDTDRGHMMLNGIVHPIDEVKRASGKILHMSSVPFVGAGPGDVARMTLDWDRRYTMMRYHTALHLLSSVAYKDFGAQITGNNIGTEKARIDLNLEGLSEDVVRDIEKGTNDLISRAIPVDVRNVERSEAESMVDPKKTRLDMIPPSVRKIRLIVIGDKDIDACGGTHVHNTSEIAGIEIFNTINKGRDRKRLEIRLKR